MGYNQNHALHFPRFSLTDLRDLCFSVYQVNLVPSYIQDKLQREDEEEFQFDELAHEPNLIRVRVYSRFINSTKTYFVDTI